MRTAARMCARAHACALSGTRFVTALHMSHVYLVHVILDLVFEYNKNAHVSPQSPIATIMYSDFAAGPVSQMTIVCHVY